MQTTLTPSQESSLRANIQQLVRCFPFRTLLTILARVIEIDVIITDDITTRTDLYSFAEALYELREMPFVKRLDERSKAH